VRKRWSHGPRRRVWDFRRAWGSAFRIYALYGRFLVSYRAELIGVQDWKGGKVQYSLHNSDGKQGVIGKFETKILRLIRLVIDTGLKYSLAVSS
jgi:hypothetical protein